MPSSHAHIKRPPPAALDRLPDGLAAHPAIAMRIVDDFADHRLVFDRRMVNWFGLTGRSSAPPIGQSARHSASPPTIYTHCRAILDECDESRQARRYLGAYAVAYEAGHQFGLSDTALHGVENVAW